MSDAAIAHGSGAPPSTLAPESYGRYQLLERIGKGGMAEVFRAMSVGAEGFRRVFVIKRIRAEKSGSAEFIQMFCEEARLSAMLHHPNIVQVYDFGQIDGSYFLAMEYLRGKDLSSVMRALRLLRQAMPPALALFIAQQVAAGLHYAHTLTGADGKRIQIVHRDVTPSNIMLLRTGDVKILDFGIAKAATPGELTESTSGRVKGKLAYLSPEQVRCSPLDGRADVFALGVVLWEMLVGQRLFSGDNEFHTMRNVLTHPVPAPSSKRPGIPASLDAVVARALERDRDKRYPTALAMSDDLERVVEVERHSAQAIPRLLKELFGGEVSEVSRELPDASHATGSNVAGPVSLSAPPALPSEVAFTAEPPEVVLEVEPEAMVEPGAAVISDRRGRGRLVAILASATLAGCLGWAAWVRMGRIADPSPAASSDESAPVVAAPPVAAPPVAATPVVAPPVAAPPVLTGPTASKPVGARVDVTKPAAAAPINATASVDRRRAAVPGQPSAGKPPRQAPNGVPQRKVAAGRVADKNADAKRLRPARKPNPRSLSTDVTIDPFR